MALKKGLKLFSEGSSLRLLNGFYYEIALKNGFGPKDLSINEFLWNGF